ncbi:MAG: glycosyltransferase [Conexivisphaerales archaeon]
MNKKKSISFDKPLLVSSSPRRSGLGEYVFQLYSLNLFSKLVLFKNDADISEFGYDNVVKYDKNPFHIRTFQSIITNSIWSAYIKEYRHVHLSSFDYLHLSKFHPSVSVTIHDIFPLEKSTRMEYSIFYRTYSKFEINAMRRVTGVVAISNFIANRIEQFCHGAEISVIHNWTDERFKKRDPVEVRKFLGLPQDKKIILNVSTDEKRKNTAILPKIMEALSNDYLLIKIGGNPNLWDNSSNNRIIFRNNLPESIYPFYFNASDAYLATSTEEGFGRPLIEALVSQIPVISSDIEVFREVLFSIGNFCAPNDLNCWIGSIKSISDEKEDIIKKYKKIESHYRPERAVKEYSDFFKKLGAIR